MAQKYFFITISFYRNIVCQNVSCEQGLNKALITLFCLLIKRIKRQSQMEKREERGRRESGREKRGERYFVHRQNLALKCKR